MAVISMKRAVAVDVEIITILHKKLASPHHTKAGADFITKFPLNMIERHGEVFVASDMCPEDIRDQLFIRGSI